MQVYSPDWFSKAILELRDRAELRICSVLGERRGPLIISIFLFLACSGYVFLDLRGAFSSATPIHRLFDGYPLLVAIAVFGYLAMRACGLQDSAVFVMGTGIVTTLAFSQFAGQPGSVLELFAVLMGSRVLLYVIFRVFGKSSPRTKAVAAVAAAFSVLNLFIYLGSGWHEYNSLYLTKPNRLLFLLVIPLLETQLLAGLNGNALFSKQLLFPTQLIYPVPTRLKHWLPAPDRWKMQARGLVDIGFGFLMIWVFNLMAKASFKKYDLGFTEFLGFGLYSYLETYALSCGSLSIPVGLARLWGFNLPDGYSLPLLAASPFERWRRWNTYFFNFIRWAVFLPVAKLTGSVFIAVMLTFLATLLLHVSTASPLNFIDLSDRILSSDAMAFFLCHGFVVYLSLKLNLRIFDGTTRAAWGGVALTWLLMILIHSLNRWSA